MSQEQKMKFPIIYYEETEPGQPVNPIPYIEMEKEDQWPYVLFIQEYRETGEFEPDDQGNPQPIFDMLIHKFVDMEILKEKLDTETNDKVRVALGMKPLAEAQAAGKPIMDRIMAAAEERNKKVST